MAIDYKFEEVKAQYECEYGRAQATVECNIDTSAKGGVSKLLSVSGDVTIKNIEALTHEAKINATLNFKVICLNTDGELQSYDYLCDFACKIDNGDIEPNSILFAKGCVLDIDSAIANGNIKLQAVSDIVLMGTKFECCNCLVSVDDNVLTRKVIKDIQIINTKFEETVEVTEEYETGVNVEKVLFFDSDTVCNNIKISENCVTVSGEVSSAVVYQSGGMITTKTFNLPYCEEISVTGVDKNDRVKIGARVKNSKIILAGVEDDNVLRLEFEIEISGIVYSYNECELIEDLCSPNHKVEFTSEVSVYNYFVNQIHCSDKINGSAELNENMVGVRKILATSIARNCVTNTYFDNDSVIVEGVMACNVIYEDSNTEINSMLIELPYSLPFDRGDVCEGDKLTANAMVEVLGAKVKRDREIDVTAMISVSIAIYRPMKIKCVNSFTVGEEIDCRMCAISIYQSNDGEDIWEVAKNLKAPIEKIVAQNPSLSDGVVRGQKVIYYRQINS